MPTKFLNPGNRIALRVPKVVAEKIGASEGKQADMTVENSALVVKVTTRKRQHRYSLQSLIAKVTPENIHPETNWGPRRGNEVW
jgi:antitoxin MazE